MSNKRYAAKIDNNQAEIVSELKKIPGISLAYGHDDILVGYKSKTYWFEVKDPKHLSKLTGKIRPSAIKPSQKKLKDKWTGHYSIVWNVQQIFDEIGVINVN